MAFEAGVFAGVILSRWSDLVTLAAGGISNCGWRFAKRWKALMHKSTHSKSASA